MSRLASSILAVMGLGAALAIGLLFLDGPPPEALEPEERGPERPVEPEQDVEPDQPETAAPGVLGVPAGQPSAEQPSPPPAPTVSDRPFESLSEDGPLPYRKERLLMPAEIDERVQLLEADKQMALDAQDAAEVAALEQRIADLYAIKALNLAVNDAWLVAKQGKLDQALDLLRAHAEQSSDEDVRGFLAEQERALLDRFADAYRR